MNRFICTLALLAAGASLGCTDPAEGDAPVVVVPPVEADAALDMMPDLAPEPDLGPPARVLVERPPLPFAADNRFVNPGFDPAAPYSWVARPGGTRIADHRLPFDGPALKVEPPSGERAEIYGRVIMSAHPLELSAWIGVEPGDGPPEEAHAGRVGVYLYGYTPDRDEVESITYRMTAADDIAVGPGGLVWRRYEGGTRRPTLGWSWLEVVGREGLTVGIGAPSARLEPADPTALRVRAPAMATRAARPDELARLRALAQPHPPRPMRPVSAGPRGLRRR